MAGDDNAALQRVGRRASCPALAAVTRTAIPRQYRPVQRACPGSRETRRSRAGHSDRLGLRRRPDGARASPNTSTSAARLRNASHDPARPPKLLPRLRTRASPGRPTGTQPARLGRPSADGLVRAGLDRRPPLFGRLQTSKPVHPAGHDPGPRRTSLYCDYALMRGMEHELMMHPPAGAGSSARPGRPVRLILFRRPDFPARDRALPQSTPLRCARPITPLPRGGCRIGRHR